MSKIPPDRLIFTDLDGTLLERNSYSWKPAQPALDKAEKAGVPVIFCTSKTRTEIESYRKRIGSPHPFISENGGGIFIPKGYFKQLPPGCKRKGKYFVIELGAPYKQLREAIRKLRKSKLKVTGFGDMSLLQLRKHSGLSLREAYLARKREYDEPFLLEEPEQKKKLLDAARKLGLQVSLGTRFHHLTGNNDKGLAVRLLTSIYNEEADKPLVIAGLGDSPNDYTMLRAVTIPYLVKRHDGSYATTFKGFNKADGIGPVGWNKSVLKFLKEEF
jgi:mannosyl-3-phosphoglycerate phosphatase